MFYLRAFNYDDDTGRIKLVEDCPAMPAYTMPIAEQVAKNMLTDFPCAMLVRCYDKQSHSLKREFKR